MSGPYQVIYDYVIRVTCLIARRTARRRYERMFRWKFAFSSTNILSIFSPRELVPVDSKFRHNLSLSSDITFYEVITNEQFKNMTRPHKSSLPSQSRSCHLYRSVIRHLINIINSDMSVGNSLLPFTFCIPPPNTAENHRTFSFQTQLIWCHSFGFDHFPDHTGKKIKNKNRCRNAFSAAAATTAVNFCTFLGAKSKGPKSCCC